MSSLISPETDVVAEKGALRAAMRLRLAARTPAERRSSSQLLVEKLAALPAWLAARRIGLFAPLASEIDLDLLWTGGALADKECVYPRVAGMRMHLFRVTTLAELQPTRWGLREPPAEGGQSVELGDLDLILVPGLAFTGAGARLGRGGGFYDRCLRSKPTSVLAVGAGFSFQVLDHLPVAEHDVPLDGIVTEEHAIRL